MGSSADAGSLADEDAEDNVAEKEADGDAAAVPSAGSSSRSIAWNLAISIFRGLNGSYIHRRHAHWKSPTPRYCSGHGPLRAP